MTKEPAKTPAAAAAAMGALALVAVACGPAPTLECGDTTVEQDGQCLPDATDTDADTDAGAPSPTSSTGDATSPDTNASDASSSSTVTSASESESDSDSDSDSASASNSDTGGSSSGADTPAWTLRVFTTSEEFTADLHGIEGADTVCQQAAETAGLQGTFVAWLSTHDVDALDRVGTGPWDRVDGQRAFDDVGDLLDEALVPLTVDEFGDPLPNDTLQWVRTGTGADGRRAETPNCIGGGDPIEFNYDGPGPYGAAAGFADEPEQWTDAEFVLDCDMLARLYCFEIVPE